jgi:hypothetical protein
MARPTAVPAFAADRVGQHHDHMLRRAFAAISAGAVRDTEISAAR